MKATITFLLLLIFTSAYSQTEKYQTLLDSVKHYSKVLRSLIRHNLIHLIMQRSFHFGKKLFI